MAIPLPPVADVLGYAATTITPFLPYIGLYAGVGLGLGAVIWVIQAFRGN